MMGGFARRWLRSKRSHNQADKPDVKANPLAKKEQELIKLIDATKRDLEFWHRQFRSYKFTICLQCKQKLMVWPYEKTAYYHVKDGYVHHACQDKYLAARTKVTAKRGEG